MSNSLLKDACLEGSVLKVIELMTECPDIVAFLITTHYGWFLELNENICHLLLTEASRSGQLEKLAVYFTKNVQKSLLEMACARRLLAIALLLHELDPILFPITTPALAAAIEGDRYDVFVALLSKRGYREGEGLLHQASSEAKYARYLDVLLTHGYDKDVNATHPDWDVHPLRLAVRTGSMQIVQSLLKHKAIITNQEVTSACRGFYLEITRLFLRQGPKELDMDLTALLYHAVSNQNAPMVELLLEYNATITSVIMRIACQIFPNLQVLRLLLRTGTDIRLATMNLIATQIMFDAMAEEGISFDTWSPNYSYILTRAFEFDIELSEDELISILHTQIRSCALEEKKEAICTTRATRSDNSKYLLSIFFVHSFRGSIHVCQFS